MVALRPYVCPLNEKLGSQGETSFVGGETWYTSYSYFNATGYRVFLDGLDWRAFDATTGEMAPLNTSDLTNWISAPRPTLYGAEQTGLTTAQVSWQLPGGSEMLAGGFAISRKLGMTGPWIPVTSGTADGFLVPDSNGPLQFQCFDQGLVPGSYTYHIVYSYGGQSGLPVDIAMQQYDAATLATWDSDADGYSDLAEWIAGTDRFSSRSIPAYPRVTAAPQTILVRPNVPKPITLTGAGGDGSAYSYDILSAPSNGTITPAANHQVIYQGWGWDWFVYMVSDASGNRATAIVNTVPAVVVSGPQAFTVLSGDSWTGTFTASAGPNGTPPVPFLVAGSGPTKGTVTDAGNGTFTYAAGGSGVDSFQISADGADEPLTVTVQVGNTIQITGPDPGQTVNLGRTGTFSVSASSTGGTITIEATGGNSYGTLTAVNNGTSIDFTYVAGTLPGTDYITVTVTAYNDTVLLGTKTVTIPVTVAVAPPLHAESKGIVLEPWENSGSVQLTATGGDGSPIVFSLVEEPGSGPNWGDASVNEDGVASYYGFPPVSDGFRFKVEDASGSDTGQVSVTKISMGVKITAWTPGKIGGTLGTTGTQLPYGDVAILLPNGDNDDGSATPNHRDNADTVIHPNDDDIVMIEITAYKADTTGTLVLDVPSGIRVFKADGSLLTNYNLDPDQTTRLYVEGLDDFDGATLSATYTPVDDGGTGEEPAAAAAAGNPVTGSIVFSKVNFIATNIYRGFDPPIVGDKDPSGKTDDLAKDWWTIAHYIPSETQSVLDYLKVAQPGYYDYLNHIITNTLSEVKYVIDPNNTPVRNGVALTQLEKSSDGKGVFGLVKGSPGQATTRRIPEFDANASAVTSPGVMELSVKEPPYDGGTHPVKLEIRGITKPGNVELATESVYGELNVLIAPARIVTVGLWYLDDGAPNDAPPDAYRNAAKVLEKLNQTFWQARVLFVPAPANFIPAGIPAFKKLEMPDYGTLRAGGNGIRELDFRPITSKRDELVAVRNKIREPAQMAPKLNIVVVGHAAPVPLPAFQAEGFTILQDTCFIQSELATMTPRRTFSGQVPAHAADMMYGDNVIKDDYYKMFAHEVGHALNLSSRHPDQADPFFAHDQDEFPLYNYNFDGTPVTGSYPIKDIDPNIRLLPVDAPINEIPSYKRRSKFPLMYQSVLKPGNVIGAVDAVPMSGNGLRSIWIRHEEWQRANIRAGALQ